MDRKVIADIRKDLGLTEADGIDSDTFFYGAPGISEGFINEYRKTLDDLAAFDRKGHS